MSFKQLIWRNLKKNIRNYYLYVFALIFNVTLYFSFVTLQYDPAMDEVAGSIKGEAGMRAASVMLIVIVIVFLIYANNLFIKQRGKEIGLYQLVGLKKIEIFRLISIENILLYFGSLLAGIFLGFISSKLLMMMLLKMIGMEEVAKLQFSTQAFVQTIIMFAATYLVIMVLNAIYIKRQSILSLFHATSTSEGKKLKVSIFEMVLGVLGLGLIAIGYFLSTKLFDESFYRIEYMLVLMLAILASVIIGTYLFYKGSISFLFNLLRKRDAGYLSINKVLSLSSIMFRMKSNSLLLTVITTVSALAIGLLSLSFISYYTIEKQVNENVIYDFSIPDSENAARFMAGLQELGIEYEETTIDLASIEVDLEHITEIDEVLGAGTGTLVEMLIVPDSVLNTVDLSSEEAVFVNHTPSFGNMLTFKEGPLSLHAEDETFEFQFIGVEDELILPMRVTFGAFPVLAVDAKVYEELDEKLSPAREFSVSVGIDIAERSEVETANRVFNKLDLAKWAGYESQSELKIEQKTSRGLMMFIVGFLGLTALITSGCILYFKQMDEGEEEKGTYTILRKLGFTQSDILNGIKVKQLFNFGIPLLLGICHGYFAVKSGWFFFGTELWTPMIIMMIFYTILYSIFAVLSVLHYKKIIKDSL
ncbi:ABC transporter permease [Ralstonia pickettii]|nr:ABC transporter permease [Ralstonia pickettii]